MKEPQQVIRGKTALDAVLDRSMNEKQWLTEVVAYAHEHNWRVAHFRPARTAKGWRTPMQGDPGFPDLVLARKGIVLLVELKKWGEQLSDEQLDWIVEAEGHWWTPAHRELMWKALA